jgi:branched-chain amino acid transport system permease protein
VVGVVFGIPSLRIKGLYLAVATLAAQFFLDWAFLRIKWFTNDSPRARSAWPTCRVFGMPVDNAVGKYCSA